MTHPLPEGENLRKAVKWISEKRKADPDQDMLSLAEKASIRFDLTPGDSDFLSRFVMTDENDIRHK